MENFVSECVTASDGGRLSFIWHQGCELHITGVKGFAYNKRKPLPPRLALRRCASDSWEYIQKKKNQWAAPANISAAGLGKDTFSIEEKPDRNCICINHRRFSKTIYHLEKKNLASPPAISHPGYTVVSDTYMLLSFPPSHRKLGRDNGWAHVLISRFIWESIRLLGRFHCELVKVSE